MVATALSLFLLRQGQVDRRELRRNEARRQASKVTAWTDVDRVDGATLHENCGARILIGNSSHQAVYDVFVAFRDPTTGQEQRHVFGDIAPRSVIEFRVARPTLQGGLAWEPGALFPRTYFRDANAQRWLRDSAGRLRPDNEDGSVWNTLTTERSPLTAPRWTLQRPRRAARGD